MLPPGTMLPSPQVTDPDPSDDPPMNPTECRADTEGVFALKTKIKGFRTQSHDEGMVIRLQEISRWRATSRQPIPVSRNEIGQRRSMFHGAGTRIASRPVKAILNYPGTALQRWKG